MSSYDEQSVNDRLAALDLVSQIKRAYNNQENAPQSWVFELLRLAVVIIEAQQTRIDALKEAGSDVE